MTKVAAIALAVMVFAACSGDNGESLSAVCDDFHALVEAGEDLPGDWAAFEPVVDRAATVDELEGAASNIRSDVEGDGTGNLRASVEGLYNRCQAAGWDGLDG